MEAQEWRMMVVGTLDWAQPDSGKSTTFLMILQFSILTPPSYSIKNFSSRSSLLSQPTNPLFELIRSLIFIRSSHLTNALALTLPKALTWTCLYQDENQSVRL